MFQAGSFSNNQYPDQPHNQDFNVEQGSEQKILQKMHMFRLDQAMDIDHKESDKDRNLDDKKVQGNKP